VTDGPGLKSKLIFWGNLLLGVAIFTYVMRLYGAEALAILRFEISPAALAAFLGVSVSSIVCLSWRWGYILRGLSKPLSLTALVLYRSAGHSLEVLVPSGRLGGDPLRAWLAVRAGVPANHSIASTAVDRTLEIGATAPFSILFAMLLLQHGVPQLERAVVTVTVATAALALGIVMALRKLRSGSGLISALMRKTGADQWPVVDSSMDVIEASEQATVELAGQRPRMIAAFAVGLLSNLIVIAEFALLLHAFGLPTTSVAVVGAIFATGAAHMFPIPAGVGVLEGAQMWLFEMLGHSAEVGLAVGLAVRFRELLWMVPGLIYLIARNFAPSLERARPA